MCITCWSEAGSPQIQTLEVATLAWRAQHIDEFGAFHIVVSDMNIDDSDFQYCMQHQESTSFEREWGRRMLLLSEEERMSVMGLADGYWGVEAWPRRSS